MPKYLISKNQCLLALSFLGFLTASETVWAIGKPAASDDVKQCYKSTAPDMAITYCSQAIESGQLSGKGLASAFFRRGNAYYEKSDYDRAILDYDQAIQLNPSHTSALSNRGAAYARKGDYDQAIQNYDEAIRLNPGHADAFSNRGVAYARKGDYDRAIENYDEAIRLNPKHAHALSDRGIAYGRKGDYDRAIENYDEAIRLNPNHVNALYNRGNAYRRKGDYNQAVQDYDQVIRLNPKHADAYSNRGLVRFYQGQFTTAIPDLTQALEFDPANLYRVLLLYLARARAGSPDQERLSEAAKGLDLKEWPGPIVSMYLGKLPEHAVLDAVADADPSRQRKKRCQAHFYIGQQLLIRQNSNEAVKMFRETLATEVSVLFEYEAAQAELRRLGN